jgi:hypothetical protein
MIDAASRSRIATNPIVPPPIVSPHCADFIVPRHNAVRAGHRAGAASSQPGRLYRLAALPGGVDG